jgi:hypothetical protein
MLALGPLIGYLFGAAILQFYVDMFSVSKADLNIGPTDSNWLGAWYVGFLFFGLLVFLNAFPFLYFPKKIK